MNISSPISHDDLPLFENCDLLDNELTLFNFLISTILHPFIHFFPIKSGILAIRGGLKSAGKNAVVGGVLLAAIEGLNIAVTRMLMPMLQKNQNTGAPIDMLEPPNDPLRPRMNRSQPLYRPQEPAPVPAGNANGFNIDEMDNFQTDTWDSTISNNRNSSIDSTKDKKSFWNVFG